MELVALCARRATPVAAERARSLPVAKLPGARNACDERNAGTDGAGCARAVAGEGLEGAICAGHAVGAQECVARTAVSSIGDDGRAGERREQKASHRGRRRYELFALCGASCGGALASQLTF